MDCGRKLKSHNSTRCKKCYTKYRQKQNFPTQEELYNKLIELNGVFVAVGEYYNTTASTIRRWCSAYNIPTRAEGYCSHIKEKKQRKPAIHYAVAQIDKEKQEIIRIFPSINAVEKEGFCNRHVTDVCKHRIRKTHKGYKWAFVSELEEINPDLLKKYYEKCDISLDK